MSQEILIVSGRRQDGSKLRPSNWAERLAGSAASFENNTLVFDSRVRPCIACEKQVCLRVNRAIAEDKPAILKAIEDFMVQHRLQDISADCPRLNNAPLEPASASMAA